MLALSEIVKSESQKSFLDKIFQHYQSRGLAIWLHDDWWDESFLQLMAFVEDPSWLAREVARVKPWLALWCILERKDVDKKTRGIVGKKTINSLRSKDVGQRRKAVEALSRFENPRTIKYLIEALKDEDESVVRVATRALVKLGEPSIESLLDTLLNHSEQTRWAATRALGQIWNVADLVKLGSTDVYARQAATRAINDVRAIQPLIAALKDKDEYVRSGAARALGELGGVEVVGPLINGLKDKQANVRSGAARALGELGSVEAVESLIAARKDNNWVRIEVDEALRRIGTANKLGTLHEFESRKVP